MNKSYQDLALDIPEDYKVLNEQTPCTVTLHGLTVGDIEVYGTAIVSMVYDDATDSYEPKGVAGSLLDDENEQHVEVSNQALLQAMGDAYDRYDNYFNNSNVKEI